MFIFHSNLFYYIIFTLDDVVNNKLFPSPDIFLPFQV